MDTAGFTRRLERLLADAERVTGLTIVVHDRTGAFANTLGQFHYHRHRFCAAGRSDAPGYGGRCLAHCYHQGP